MKNLVIIAVGLFFYISPVQAQDQSSLEFKCAGGSVYSEMITDVRDAFGQSLLQTEQILTFHGYDQQGINAVSFGPETGEMDYRTFSFKRTYVKQEGHGLERTVIIEMNGDISPPRSSDESCDSAIVMPKEMKMHTSTNF